MSAELIGNLIPTKIPGYEDAADIQSALRVYHYGSYDFDISETNSANLVSPSIAYTINSLQSQITNLEDGYIPDNILTAKGSLLSAISSGNLTELPVGLNGQILSANSATSSGLQWVTPDITLTNTATVTNKTINLSSNTLTGTISQFNTSLSDADFATTAGSETLSNKTLTSSAINVPVSTVTASTINPTVADNGRFIIASSSSTQTISVPTNSTSPISIGSQFYFSKSGSGTVRVSAATPGTTTITSTGAVSAQPEIRAVGSSIALIKVAIESWLVVGDII